MSITIYLWYLYKSLNFSIGAREASITPNLCHKLSGSTLVSSIKLEPPVNLVAEAYSARDLCISYQSYH